MYERRYNLTLDQLLAIVNGETQAVPCNHYANLCSGMQEALTHSGHVPLGAAANEIGIIFMLGTDDRAEKTLADMLAKPLIGQVAAFYLIQRRDEINPESLAALEKFEQDPANTEHMSNILAAIEKIKKAN